MFGIDFLEGVVDPVVEVAEDFRLNIFESKLESGVFVGGRIVEEFLHVSRVVANQCFVYCSEFFLVAVDEGDDICFGKATISNSSSVCGIKTLKRENTYA